MSCLPQTPERRTGEGSKVRSEASRAHGWARPIRATPGGDHSCTRRVRTAARVFCHHGLCDRWTCAHREGAVALQRARTVTNALYSVWPTMRYVRSAPYLCHAPTSSASAARRREGGMYVHFTIWECSRQRSHYCQLLVRRYGLSCPYILYEYSCTEV